MRLLKCKTFNAPMTTTKLINPLSEVSVLRVLEYSRDFSYCVSASFVVQEQLGLTQPRVTLCQNAIIRDSINPSTVLGRLRIQFLNTFLLTTRSPSVLDELRGAYPKF